MRSLLLPAALVAAVLTGAAVWVGVPGQVGVDEGVAVLQARSISDDGTWALEHPLQRYDPDGSAFPLRSSTRTDEGYVPFAKHPLYPRLLAWIDGRAGVGGMVALSIAATLVASLGAGWLTARLDRRLGSVGVVATGLASPLLFDSGLVIAHAVGAAAVAVGAVAAVRHRDRRTALTPWLTVVAACTAAVVLLRGEGILLVGAVAAVIGILWLRDRSTSWLALGAVTAASGAAALLGDRAWTSHLLGRTIGLPGAPASGDSFFESRVHGLLTTLVRPSYGAGGRHLLLAAGVLVLVIVVLGLRRGGLEDERAAGIAAVVAAASVVAWSLSGPAGPVPGILLAFPVLWVGLSSGRWTSDGLAVALVGAAAAFAVAVAATQYRQGGGFEWGFRYVAIALPLVVPVAVLGLARAWDAIEDRTVARAVTGSLALLTVCLGGVAITSQHRLGRFNEELGREILELAPASQVGPGDPDGRPVIVSADFLLPQLIWPEYERARWLRLRGDGPIEVGGPDLRLDALAAAGLDRYTFVTRDLDRDLPLLGSGEVVEHHDLEGWEVAVVVPGIGRG